ncbi:MAG TPA: type II secretion system F family protein [Stellaceae bacterium]|nr:type II secretion system F family protein [Stellaceae bacterium]
MSSAILLAVLGTTALLGAALVWALRADRRRESRRQRLQAIILPGANAAAASAVGPELSLRRPQQNTGAGRFLLFPGLWARLEGALAATGDWIGAIHLAVAAAVAAILAMALVSRVLGLSTASVLISGIAAAICGGWLLLYFAQSRFRSRFLEVFPDALDLLARAVRAGLPVLDAMEVAAKEIPDPVGGEFRRTIDEMRIGVEMEEALQRTADRIRVQDFRFYVVALILQRRTGGGLAETLNNLSNIIRRRKEVRLKARALSAEAKASAVVLSLLPLVVGGLMYTLNRPLMSILFDDPRGRFSVGLALLSLLAGIAAMVFIIRRSLR